ncbi:3-[(3aS,4S,7aS)-7a-methyl-1, 5-dioxo-octahydro-1H-inden-4-yl]propanoyl:CoA ligase [Sinobacterium norvegicum]|uniref:3-[(3aS,4S,7aS)-7a-methyl-1, 5-dioxo-octahydro-1H-inden-4-yl]propanoyl:CoA ligase n=1 Tax=Sinobacterium norvegicum TaxID=1641715 RepID=A0ABM9ADI2_9GAMM|nr:FadD3 family acyl-CoA ligase [Sinobacterium norvegicum]CAH0991271.1 3-[(3aS,4S,7aS)-7a-methyl-1, 5-dioxo-octahydro-1H-inden-4-yl]propanoyl:CoA ligase [Sinobacterium norvegicum]
MTHAAQATTLPAILAAAVAQYANNTALKEGDTELSFAELAEQAQLACRAVIANGVDKGDRVAIWAPNVYEWIIAALGLQLAGAILVPLNTRLQGSEAADIIRRSGAQLLFTYPALEKGDVLDMLAGEALGSVKTVLLRGEDARAESLSDFIASAEQVTAERGEQRAASITADDPMDMLFTSGTTGKPKGVVCNHGQNIRVFESWSATVGLRSDDNYLIINPFFHSFGYKAGWLACLLTGAKILPVFAFDKDKVLAQIAEDKVTMLPGAPSLYEMILAHPERDQYDVSSLRLGVTGAAAVPVQLVNDMRQKLGFEVVVTAYGLTESCGVVTICRPDDDPETISQTSGRAIEGVEVKCANPETGDEVARGEEGEIWVRGYNVMQCYFDMPEATAEAITADGWMKTGDIGVMDERGYLKITDRLKDMYIMNGENVYPAEVEKVCYTLEGVAQVAIIGVSKPPQGEVGMAFVVKKPGSSLTAEQVKRGCAEALARYKCPFYVEFVEALPLNASGKVVKPELKKLAADILAAPVS